MDWPNRGLAENQSCAPHADFPIIFERRGKLSMNVSELDTCDDVGEPGLVPDHWPRSAGVGHHICDCEESVKSEICDELGAISGAGAGGCGGGADTGAGAGPIGCEVSPVSIATSLKSMGKGWEALLFPDPFRRTSRRSLSISSPEDS